MTVDSVCKGSEKGVPFLRLYRRNVIISIKLLHYCIDSFKVNNGPMFYIVLDIYCSMFNEHKFAVSVNLLKISMIHCW